MADSLVVIRSGATEYDLQGRIRGRLSIPLSAAGIAETQAALAAPGQVRAQARNQTPTPAATPPQAGSPPPSSPSSGGGGPSEITASGPNGQKLVLRNGQWVPK